jgi:catechol 2,3-dioxygenase-like lactoylglutathione lyase family enzyme
MMDVQGIHHIGFSVSNLQASAQFFTQLLGWSIAKERPDYPAIYVTNGHAFVTLWQAEEGAAAFDRRNNVGLHHIAFTVTTEEALNEVFSRAKNYPGVRIEFAPELVGAGPAKHCMLYEPSGIRVEFFCG